MDIRLYLFVFCLFLTSCVGVDVRGSETGLPPGYSPELRPVGETLVYECTGYEFIARLGSGEMAVWLEDSYVILSRVHSAAGVRYEEGEIVFLIKGDEAALTVDRRHYGDCNLAPQRVPWEDARRRGVDFRAVGNEPGWYLEIQRERQMLFVGDYGMLRVMTPDPDEESLGPSRIYHAVTGANDLRVEIVNEICADSMSGESFPSQVLIYLNEKTFWGCGRRLNNPWK